MKHFLFFFLLFFSPIYLFAQKPLIDSSVYNKWPSVKGANISNNGKYVLYYIRNEPIGSDILILQATDNKWKIKVEGINDAVFTQNSQSAIFLGPNDSLSLIKLGSKYVEYIDHVISFNLINYGNGEWLVYKLNTPLNSLVVRNCVTGKEKHFAAVNDYWFSSDGKALVLQTASKNDNDNSLKSLSWINLQDWSVTAIWEGTKVDNLVYDSDNKQIAFIVEDKVNEQVETSLWYYKVGTSKAVILADNASMNADSSLKIDRIYPGFSRDGSRLLFSLKEKEIAHVKSNDVKVDLDVWTYKDSKLQSQQLKESTIRSYAASIRIDNHEILRLEHLNEYLSESDDAFAVLDHRNGNGGEGEGRWNLASFSTLYILSLKNGIRNKLSDNVLSGFSFSPGGKYLIYYDTQERNYFSYEAKSGLIRNITRHLPIVPVISDRPDSSYSTQYAFVGWFKDTTAILLQDQYDIWKLDLNGDQAPICLTNGYGRKHNIIFRLLMNNHTDCITNEESLLLSAFNNETKDNGFYRKVISRLGDPQLLSMGPYMYFAPAISLGFAPIKARDRHRYLVSRMSATESPNYFYTDDFKTFTRLSNLHPEKKYNWFSTELHTWKTLDGSSSQGILYKPDDFDPHRIYPVIIHYYEIKSNQLHVYFEPAASDGSLNIPWYVSHGYLVFTPDIHFKIGDTGESFLNSVVSAANYLAHMPFVNEKKIGIQGISFGGYATNYLITHTSLFSAACSSSGLFDLISSYGSISGEGGKGGSMQRFFELGQLRIGATLWERPDLYIKNSPVFYADKITTPLLMMHTKNDGICLFANAVEFFTALRRLGKKVWMLQYNEGNHGLWGLSANDFSIRMSQFFDYYLKGSIAPKWMTVGINASRKGIDNGLASDTLYQIP
ncbi:Dipeptidyl aminopeptidase/acylaminoacyl peptidase [Chitinophaga sp. CF118]|uniref:alpha/beta hydrolase family protein n=1 Tax=Chitinophaga sp. CF118 TaxID=1884367 RepID=UPI0008E5FAB9|nr:prolyl oligopeptidase family serine peptidase [Chitinophaga sp. CF118]SFE98164.1 Dipeptidyl aminopeptidase/acylaminoacyl peptidase [Chitinophaga sp. CF118]